MTHRPDPARAVFEWVAGVAWLIGMLMVGITAGLIVGGILYA